MTTRWIAVSLAALALAGCNKKEADKPPSPKIETPAPASAPPVANIEAPPVQGATRPSSYGAAPRPATGYKAGTPGEKGFKAATPDDGAPAKKKQAKTGATPATTPATT
jgi:hypothetical protein